MKVLDRRVNSERRGNERDVMLKVGPALCNESVTEKEIRAIKRVTVNVPRFL